MATKSDEAGRKIRGEAMRQLCAHQRVIDDVRDKEGRPTGKVVCAECGAVFPDQDNSRSPTASSK